VAAARFDTRKPTFATGGCGSFATVPVNGEKCSPAQPLTGADRPLGDVRAAGPSFSGPDIRLTDLVWPQVYRKATEGVMHRFWLAAGTLFLRWPGGFRPRSDRRESVEIRPGSPRRGLSFGQCLAKNQVPVNRLVGLSQVGLSDGEIRSCPIGPRKNRNWISPLAVRPY
jgi:hypothetical protein